ncbi:MAG: response regulator [Deltaproteobacteria bacterium]|nr:response regulator [Deltaproteobacteria bacterium]
MDKTERSAETLAQELAERLEEIKRIRKENLLLSQNAKRNAELLRSTTELSNKSTQELRKAKRRAETAVKAKSQFLANMSHEIRTPLTAIVGYTDLMLEGEDLPALPQVYVEHLETIRRNGRHLLTILNDILDVSKIEAGRVDAERLPVSLQEIVDDVLGVMRQAASNKGIGFDVSYTGKVPVTIQTDPTRLRQVLMNLIGNAIKFTEQGGVRLAIEFLGSGDGESPMLQFAVADTGVGLSPAACDRIFDAFSQADASTTREFGGTGLGLTICKQLAGILGGDVSVESIEGHGSTFTLTIDAGAIATTCLVDPTVHAAEEVATEGPSTATFLDGIKHSGTRGRVLLVEDGPDNRKLISLTLEKGGFEVTCAENGAIGVEMALVASAEAEPFDLILMDMQMPVLDGYGATQKLREAGYTRPIIALTAHAMRGDREKCLEAGCDDFATKPLDRRELMLTLMSHMTKVDQNDQI